MVRIRRKNNWKVPVFTKIGKKIDSKESWKINFYLNTKHPSQMAIWTKGKTIFYERE